MVFFSFCFVIGFLVSDNTSGIQVYENLEEMEYFLRTAKIITAIPDEDAGRTEPWRITLSDGKKMLRGWFKHLNRVRPHKLGLADSYKYELAAYELDKLLGFNIVPPTVEREIEGVQGSLQLFVEDCTPLSVLKRRKAKILESDKVQAALQEIMVFEILTYCQRDSESERDILIHEAESKVCRVDFGQAFATTADFPPGTEELKEIKCSPRIRKNLMDLSPDKIKAALSPFLNQEEISALVARKDLLIKKLESNR